METYTNDKGEVVVIAEMDSKRLIHAIAKYSKMHGKFEDNNDITDSDTPELVIALKNEAITRLIPQE